MNTQNTIPWVEKYRPVKFDDIVLDDINRQIFINIIKKQTFPNLLFYGPPGTGKTEVAKIMGKIFCHLGGLENETWHSVYTRSNRFSFGKKILDVEDNFLLEEENY